MNKKIDKSQLPQPQKPIQWKRSILQIATDSKTNLNSSASQLPPTTKYGTTKNNQYFNGQTQQQKQLVITGPQIKTNEYEQNRQSRQSIQIKPQMGLTQSQYSLEQKQLLTFAANQSNEDEDERNSQYQTIKQARDSQSNFQSTLQKRTNRFQQFNKSVNNQDQQHQSPSLQSSEHTHVDRSSSKNKEHKALIYRHNLSQKEEFVAYSVVTKESKSGMFSNQKLLMLNSFKRQLVYFSKLPKLLPFASFGQMERKYLTEEKPKQVIELDKVRRFMFVPAKGSLASVSVSYVDEKGERKEWKLGMGNNSLMSEWIELVNEVLKKEHYSMVKSQVKYPPKPKKQPENKSNNYETKFTKTLKQEVLPTIIESSVRTSKVKNGQLNQSRLSRSGVKSTRNDNEMSKSREKQYVVDKSKFLNTKNYIIDLEDVSNEDIFYEPEPIQEEQTIQSEHSQPQTNINHHQNSQKSMSSQYWQGANDQAGGNSRFIKQLQQRQREINNEHKNRVSTYLRETNEQQQLRMTMPEPGLQPVVLSRKLSGERLSQTTHKDLNIHIDSRIGFDEVQGEKELADSGYRNEGIRNVVNSQLYELSSRLTTQSPQRIVHNHQPKSIIQPKPVPFYHEPKQQHKRVHTQIAYQQRPSQNYTHQHKITFTDSMRSSSSSHYDQINKPASKDKYRLEQPPRHSRPVNHNRSSSFVTENSQIEDIIVGGKLLDGYILNFSPFSYANNWFRLWLETQPTNRVEIYASFVRASRSLVQRLVDAPQNFTNCYLMDKNNTHIIFCMQNITFKLPFKLSLPLGLGEFISVMDFTRSEDFLGQVFKYQTQIQDEYRNYEYIMRQMSRQFNSGVLSLPVYFPMCCLITYKGISVLCKANIETANLNCYKISAQEFSRYEKEIEYLEEACHVRFGKYSEQTKAFDLYSVHLPSFCKSIVYMDNLTRFLPLMPNPLYKNPSVIMQLSGSYIQEHIRKGMVQSGKDVEQIEKHLIGNVIKRYAEEFVSKGGMIGAGELGNLLYEKGGLREEYLGLVYRRVQEREQQLMTKSFHASSLILTQIVITQYAKACRLYFMKEHIKQLYRNISSSSQTPKTNNGLSSSQASNNSKTIKNLQPYTSVGSTFGHSYSSVILEILHYLIYRNSKVWNVLSVALDEKYGLSEFMRQGSHRQGIDMLMDRVCVEYLVLGLLGKMGVDVEVKSWSNGMTWGTLPLNEDNLTLKPSPQSDCYPLAIFHPEYSSLISQLQQISSLISFSSKLTDKNLFAAILQILNISQESHQNQSTLIKSSSYQLLEYGFPLQRQLLDLALSFFVPTTLKDSSQTKAISRQKEIDLYQNLLNQQLVRNSKDVSIRSFEGNLNGIKWLIKQNHYQLAQVLIEEQLQAISIWYTESLLQTRCKFLDLAANFYQKKLNNRNNMGVEYAIRSLQLAMDNKQSVPLTTCAQKCFQAASIHFDCGLIQKSLQLYELAEEFVSQSQRNKPLIQSDLSIEFLTVYLRKAQIKLTMGRKNQTLYECLQCLRKCEQFHELLDRNQTLAASDYVKTQHDKQQLTDIEINVFQIIFRCYEITKNLPDMQRISQLCCTKFIEDKLLFLKANKYLTNKNLQSTVNPNQMSKLLKICWISLISKFTSSATKTLNLNQQYLTKTMTIPSSLTRKSFCLSGAFAQSKKSPQLNQYPKLSELLQKLQALCKLYPKSRYDSQTLSIFVCKQVAEASTRMNVGRSIERGEYQLIGSRKKGVMSGKVEEMISAKMQNQGEMTSVLYERLWEVINQLTGHDGGRSSKKIERYQTESGLYYQRRGSRQKQRYESTSTQNYPQTSAKKPGSRFYHSPEVFTSQFDQQDWQDQPELRMSFILERQQRTSQNISAYDIYSLKDQMDRKYMLMEAMFGLCGRNFVLGCIQEAVENDRRKTNGLQPIPVFFQ